jgi:hypothetical protein
LEQISKLDPHDNVPQEKDAVVVVPLFVEIVIVEVLVELKSPFTEKVAKDVVR